MGEVYVARKTGAGDFEKFVALKLLLAELATSPDAVSRFYDEARLSARLHHPNIVEVFDVGEAEGRPFLAMQLVDGVSLAQLLRSLSDQGVRVPLPVVRAIGLGICEALGYAHALCDSKGRPLKLVHRDVTPSNILLSTSGAVQLTDFGIARVGEAGTRSGVIKGKAAYIAPEQLSHASRLDGRADLYAAAVTLYEVIAGVNPFRGETQEETLRAVLEGRARPLRELRPDVTPGLEQALHRAMARTPGERFSDAASFRDALLDGPVSSAPELAEFLRRVRVPTRDEAQLDPSGAALQELRVTRRFAGGASVSAPRPRLERWVVVAGASLVAVIVVSLAAGVWGRRAREEARRGPLPSERVRVAGAPESAERAVGSAAVTLGRGAAGDGGPVAAAEGGAGGGGPVAAAEGGAGGGGPVAAAEGGAGGGGPVAAAEGGAGGGGPVAAARGAVGGAGAVRVRAASLSPPPHQKAAAIGYLTADAVPWADVFVDGKHVATTPVARLPVAAGVRTVSFRAPGGTAAVRKVTVVEGRESNVRVEFPAQ